MSIKNNMKFNNVNSSKHDIKILMLKTYYKVLYHCEAHQMLDKMQ